MCLALASAVYRLEKGGGTVCLSLSTDKSEFILMVTDKVLGGRNSLHCLLEVPLSLMLHFSLPFCWFRGKLFPPRLRPLNTGSSVGGSVWEI